MTRRAWLVTAALLLAPSAAPADSHGPARGASAHRDIPYVFMLRDRTQARQRSLDIFLPPKSAGAKPPLIVFVHGGFWQDSDDRYGIGNALVQALLSRNVAVALVRYPLAPAHRFPAQPEHVARAVSYLHRVAGTHGYDPKRMYLFGHSAGAHLASLVALDPRYLRDAAAPPEAVAGVIAVSGIYDLRASGPLTARADKLVTPVFGTMTATLRAASPVVHARRGVPFLILSGENDFDGLQPDARRFAAALRAAGEKNVQEIVIEQVNHFQIVNLGGKANLIRDMMLRFVDGRPVSDFTEAMLRARRVWQEPPYSSEPFWTHAQRIRAHPVDERFLRALHRVFDTVQYELKSYPLKTFHAIDLFEYLDALPPGKIGSGEYLVVTNVRHEKEFWWLEDIRAYRPVIVVGIDDERNLFRLSTFYQNKREYSWQAGVPFMAARPVGAFVHFLDPPPAWLNPPTLARYSLTVDSFARAATDPLAAMSDLPKDVYDVMRVRNACFSCHSFRGTDVRAGHVRARDGEFSGGFALPLESYPPEPWRQFMLEHEKSAAAIGVRPNLVTGPITDELYRLVVEERKRQGKAPANSPEK